MIVVSNKFDMRNTCDGDLILNGPQTILDFVIINVKFLPRGDSKDSVIYINDVVDKTKLFINNMYAVSKATRLDIFEFFENQMLNYVNRKLTNRFSDKKIVGETIEQFVFNIDKYNSGMDDLIALSQEDKIIGETIKDFHVCDLSKIEEISNDVNKDDIETEVMNYVSIDEDLVSLVMFTNVSALKVSTTRIPSNKLLESGQPMLVNDISKLFPNSGLTNGNIQKETIVFTDNDESYILDKTGNGNVSIRKSNLDEFWAIKKYKYEGL